jgi:sugar lactone lactonase YvrE
MKLERNNEAICGERSATSNVYVAYRHQRVLTVFALAASLLVSACGGGAAAPVVQAPAGTADIAAVTTPAANTASGGAGSIPTVDFMARMPTFAALPTEDIGPSPVELVRSFTVDSPNVNGFDVDRDGNVYAASRFEGRILKYSPEGELLLTWSPDTTGSQLGVQAVDEQGDVYVHADDYHIQKFDSDGKFLLKWGGQGFGPGQFSGPPGLTIDRKGNYYVSDSGNQRIQKFDPKRKFLLMWGSAGTGDGQFEVPAGIVADARGDVYVSDYAQGTVQKFDSNGRFLLKWGSKGTEPGQFTNQWVTAVDKHGDVYVADTENRRIQVFNPDGKFLAQWNHSGDKPFVYPEDVAIDRKGYIYVSEDRPAENSRIHVFRPRK